MKFAHLADTHLGYRQYGLFEREKDFYEVFDKVIDKIIEEKLTNFLERQEEFKFNFPVYAYSDCVKCLNSKNLDNKEPFNYLIITVF